VKRLQAVAGYQLDVERPNKRRRIELAANWQPGASRTQIKSKSVPALVQSPAEHTKEPDQKGESHTWLCGFVST
jgi:hypothetical protein